MIRRVSLPALGRGRIVGVADGWTVITLDAGGLVAARRVGGRWVVAE